MATDKKGFILYADQKETFDQLSSEKAGDLIKFIFAYVNDEDPKTDDPFVNLAFTPIRQQLKRDLEKWAGTKEAKSLSGQEGNLKRWNLDIYEKYKKGKLTLIESLELAKVRKASHTDNVQSQDVANIAVNVTDTVNDKVKVKVKEKKEPILHWNEDLPTGIKRK